MKVWDVLLVPSLQHRMLDVDIEAEAAMGKSRSKTKSKAKVPVANVKAELATLPQTPQCPPCSSRASTASDDTRCKCRGKQRAAQREKTFAARVMQWRWLFIDEISMVFANLLAEVSQHQVSSSSKLTCGTNHEHIQLMPHAKPLE